MTAVTGPGPVIGSERVGDWRQVLAAYRAGESRVRYLPRVLCVEPTSGCDLACTSCPRPPGRPRSIAVDRLAAWVDREPEPFRAAPLWLHFAGEPLLHPQLGEIMAVLRERAVTVMISTNANRMDDRRARMLLDGGLALVVFSIDAARPETYARIRIGGDFATVQRNVRRFIELRDDRRTPVTQAQLVVGDQPMPEVWEFLRYWATSGIDTIQLKRYSTRAGALAHPRGVGPPPTTARCLDPWRNVIVRADGTVVPCCADFGDRLILGSLEEQPLAEIWNGASARALRSALAVGGAALPEACRACSDASSPENNDGIIRYDRLPSGSAELAEMLAGQPRHLLFDCRNGLSRA